MVCAYSKHADAATAAGAKFLIVDVQAKELEEYYKSRFGFARSDRIDGKAQLYRPTNIIRSELAEVFGGKSI